MGAFFGILIIIAIYFLPTIISWGKSFVLQVFLLNLFLGWTFLGWIIALIWACKTEKETQIHVHNAAPVSDKINHDDVYTALEKLSRLHKDGIITDAEFAQQKNKLLNN